MIRAEIERIEDGKVAVIAVKGMGLLNVPVSKLPFKAREGQHLTLNFTTDSKSTAKTLNAVKTLQAKLLKKSNS